MEVEAFLRLVLRARRDPAARAALPAAVESVDWPAVIEAANTERVTPLLYHTLKGLPLPPDALARLREIYIESVRINILRFQQLERILAALYVRSIPAVLLKGAALAEPVYGSVALRPMTDLDLLVPQEQLEDAVAACAALGYTRTLAEAATDTDMVEACVVQMILPGSQNSYLELHWDVLHPPYFQGRVDSTWLWQTSRPVSVGGKPARLLSPEAQVLHLCAHLCLHHFGQGLLWQNDVAEVLYRCQGGFDWDLLYAKAVEYELATSLRLVLPAAVDQLSAPAPLDMPARLRKLPASAREQRTFRRLMDSHQSGASLTFNFMEGLPGWRSRLYYLLTSVFPSPAYMTRRYGIRTPLLLPFYYPYRWFTGLKRR